jgi:LuxR family maltose regulon positive regulatory protein
MGAKFRAATIKPPVLVRRRLLDRLAEGIRGPLTLVSAPAGSGKTVLASSWVAAGVTPGPVTWVTLDDGDGKPGIFWSYALEGLGRSGVSVAGVGVPGEVDRVGRSLLVRLAVRLSERSEPVVLILDNAEELARDRVAEEIDFVLRHSAGQLRVVLATRADPVLSLHHYRLEGSVTEIRFPDLAFTPEEARALLAGHGVHLPEPVLLALTDRTRGWAAALRLATLPHEGRTDPELAADLPAVAGGDIAAYFLAEVLDTQSRIVRDFLLTTSVVDWLTPDLAVQLTGSPEAANTLRALAHAAALVERSPADHEAYRYSPLVRHLLQARLHQESPARQRWLHRRAARWLAADGRSADAIRQYAAIGDWEDAADLLVRDLAVARLLTTPPSEGLAEVFAAMPATTPGPQAAVIVAALALARLDLDLCDKHLLRAGELVPEGSGDETSALRLAVAVAASTRACAGGDPDGTFAAATAAREALSELAADGVAAPPETRALLLWNVGRAHLTAGDIDAARESLGAAARVANIPGCEYLRVRCLARLALAEAMAGRLRRAAGFADSARAVTGSRRQGSGTVPATAEVALAWVSTEQGNAYQGRRYADAAAATAEIRHDPVALGALALVRSRLLRASGQFGGAVAALTQARTAKAQLPLWLVTRLDAARTVLLVAQGRADAALDLTRQLGTAEAAECQLARGWALLCAGAPGDACGAAGQVLQRTRLPLDVRVDALLLSAASELDRAHPEAAKEALSKAVRLAEPERLRRPFRETTSRVRRVLREQEELTSGRLRGGGPAGGTGPLKGTGPLRGSGPAGLLRAGADLTTGTDADSAVIVQPLTEREREVLTYLAALLPTEEIAARMFVSVNTVKTHVRAILRKLSAERRNEAVRRARELGLV